LIIDRETFSEIKDREEDIRDGIVWNFFTRGNLQIHLGGAFPAHLADAWQYFCLGIILYIWNEFERF
jgi:hypothetical protein